MHNDWEELIPFYVAGTLPKGDISRLESHLTKCAECSKSVEEWRWIAGAVRDDAASHLRDLPPLSSEVLSIVTRQAAAAVPYPPLASPATRRANTPITLIAAAFTVILFGGLLALLVLRGLPRQSDFVALLPTTTPTSVPIDTSTPTIEPQIIVIEPSFTPVPLKISPTPVPPTEMLPPTAILPPTVISINPVQVFPTRILQTPVPPTPIPLTQPLPTFVVPTSESTTVEGMGGSAESLMSVQPDACTIHPAVPSISLYNGPGTEYPILRTIADDDALDALGTSNGWYSARYQDGTLGWVQQEKVYTTGNCDSLPLLNSNIEPTPIPPIVDSPLVVIPASGINLRGGPGTDYPLVSVARTDESYHVEAQYTRQSRVWYRLTLPGAAAAWVSASLVELSPSNATIPTAETIPPTPDVAPAASANATPSVTAGRWTQTIRVSASSCAGTNSDSTTIPITLLLNDETITLTSREFAAPLTLSRSGDGVYAGGYSTSDASISITLTFSSATSYTGSVTTARGDGCTVVSTWSGMYAGT